MSRTRTIRALNSSTAFETHLPAPQTEPRKIVRHKKPGMWEQGCPHPKEGTPSATAAACGQVACDQDTWSPAQKCHGLPGQTHPSPSGSSQEAMSKAPLKSVNWQHLPVPIGVGCCFLSSCSGSWALISSHLPIGDERALRDCWQHSCHARHGGTSSPPSG